MCPSGQSLASHGEPYDAKWPSGQFCLSIPHTHVRFLKSTIRKTSPCNEYPLEPHFYIVKLGCAVIYLFFLFLLQNIDCGSLLIDVSCPIFASTLKCTSLPYISLIGHNKMELTDVHFSFQKF